MNNNENYNQYDTDVTNPMVNSEGYNNNQQYGSNTIQGTELKERNLVMVILLSFITCGIYALVLFFIFGEELRREVDRTGVQTELASTPIAYLLSFVTCGIYMIYYVYKQALALEQIGKQKNIPTMDPIVVILFTIFFGVGFYLNLYTGSKLAKNPIEML